MKDMLLTDEEICSAQCKLSKLAMDKCRKLGVCGLFKPSKRIAQAQLAKCKPLIRQELIEEIEEGLEKIFEDVTGEKSIDRILGVPKYKWRAYWQQLKEKQKCPDCGGSGERTQDNEGLGISIIRCFTCKGKGSV